MRVGSTPAASPMSRRLRVPRASLKRFPRSSTRRLATCLPDGNEDQGASAARCPAHHRRRESLLPRGRFGDRHRPDARFALGRWYPQPGTAVSPGAPEGLRDRAGRLAHLGGSGDRRGAPAKTPGSGGLTDARPPPAQKHRRHARPGRPYRRACRSNRRDSTLRS
ncbi:hypothetical protein OUZ56_032644 [Daphnia magna]|uniref:Uncharacterized protein n=1 Tax=Daphnia magna TaxID=35525 RepID=A0ABR0B9H9_9CRUS|nr:hypothetical protein OUZ56_032644 [Daphnia magna]